MTIRSKAILAHARGQSCTMQTPFCNNDPATTVAAHSNWHMHGKSMGRKADDIFVAYACSNCHNWLDTSGAHKDERFWYWARGHAATLKLLIEDGLVTVNGYKP